MKTENPTNVRPVIVGRYQAAGSNRFLPLSMQEVERGRDHMQRILSSFDFEMGSYVVLISLLDEVAQYLPLERAVTNNNLVVCSVDNSPNDAGRLESILRRFDVKAIVGVSAVIIDGLEALGFSAEKLLAGKVVWARADAYDRLCDCPEITLRRWLEVGPSVAAECCEGAGAHVDRIEWAVEEVNGEIFLSSRKRRALEFERHPCGVKGKVVLTPCKCGNPDPRVVLL